jgi:chromosome partitioning protein
MANGTLGLLASAGFLGPAPFTVRTRAEQLGALDKLPTCPERMDGRMAGHAWRVAVIAGKGGVGKTTTVINLGAGLAATGRRCLVVDCDPQANLTSGLGLDPYARRSTLSDVVVGRATAAAAIVPTEMPGLDLLPAHPDLSAVEAELPARVNAELRLRNALRDGVDAAYEVILFDTPPNFGFHTVSALGAASSALVPLQMSAFALRGLKEVIRVIAAARRHLNPELELLGVVPTFVNNTRFSRDMLEALAEVSQVHVFRSEIGLTVRLQESALQGVPVQVCSPRSTAARAYTCLTQEIVERAGERLPSASPARLRALVGAADGDGVPAEAEEPAAAAAVADTAAVAETAAMAVVEVMQERDPAPAPAPATEEPGAATAPATTAEPAAASDVRPFPSRPVRVVGAEEPFAERGPAAPADGAEPQPGESRGHRFRLFRRARAS